MVDAFHKAILLVWALEERSTFATPSGENSQQSFQVSRFPMFLVLPILPISSLHVPSLLLTSAWRGVLPSLERQPCSSNIKSWVDGFDREGYSPVLRHWGGPCAPVLRWGGHAGKLLVKHPHPQPWALQHCASFATAEPWQPTV